MQELNINGLRGILEDLSTPQLQQMLDKELQKEKSDPAAVKLILTVLEERHAAAPKSESSASEEARQRYQDRMKELFPPEPQKRWTPLLKVASVILVVGLLFTAVLPQKAEAETFWEMLQRLSGSVIEFFNPREHISTLDYEFKTDNSGLQQVYDAVVELGITEPVVPMWLPDGCQLIEFVEKTTPMLQCIYASFSNDSGEIIYKVDVYKGEPAHQYYRDDSFYESFERNGATYTISRNNTRWSVIWTKENIECSMFIDCQEDALRRVLKSIYEMEE